VGKFLESAVRLQTSFCRREGTRIGDEGGILLEHPAVSYVDAEIGDVEESE
jgi:hypothetical protein